MQWAGTRTELEKRLREAGWESPPPTNLRSLLLCLSPEATLRELPVLPQMHEGQEDDLRIVRYADGGTTRWLLRFWDVGVRIQESQQPVWVGSISLQQREPRMRLFTLAVDNPQTRAPADLLASAWQGLRTRVVAGRNPKERITLVVD